MATRSAIGLINKDGRVEKLVYCHWDGSPSHQLPILNSHYNSVERVTELLSHGSMSVLDNSVSPNPEIPHDFETRQTGVCLFYHRDRGEELSHGMVTTPVLRITAKRRAKKSWCEFMYLYDQNTEHWDWYEL